MGKGYVVIGGARGLPPAEVSIDDIYRYRKDPNKRLTTSPFGLTPEQIEKGYKMFYPSDAVPWKGVKGYDFIEHAAGRDDALLAANELARKISLAYKGVKGVGVDPETGKVMPLKAIKQKNWKKDHPELLKEYEEKVKPLAKKYKPKEYLPYKVLTPATATATS